MQTCNRRARGGLAFACVLFLFSLAQACACDDDLSPLASTRCARDNPDAPASCECFLGDLRTCGTDVGECVSTTQACTDEGRWPGTCIPEREPGAEQCDGLDHDCDGDTSNVSPRICWEGSPDARFRNPADPLDPTVCERGEQHCIDGDWGPCVGQILNRAELCNLRDDDCDGDIDEDVSANGSACGPPTDVGSCEYGQHLCTESGETICLFAVYAQPESCNGEDDDCDGSIDEDENGNPLLVLCDNECGVEVVQCVNGEPACRTPEEEVCGDGIDNDCDGDIDEGCPCVPGTAMPCFEDMVGNPHPCDCGLGVSFCDDTGNWGVCLWVMENGPETCNNVDDDCDCVVDGFAAPCGPETDIGLCEFGESTCQAGQWGACVGAVYPEEERCDDEDNDCDGEIDEDLDPHERVNLLFAVDDSGSMCPYHVALRNALQQYAADFEGTEHRFGLILVPGPIGNGVPTQGGQLIIDFVPVAQFMSALASMNCTGGGYEPTYDVVYEVADPANFYGLSWHEDAHPMLVVIGDEEPQTFSSLSEQDVANMCIPCQLPGCEDGEPLDLYLIVNRDLYLLEWDAVVNYDLDRIIDIHPANETRYVDIFHQILTNVCIEANASDAGP